MRKLLPLGLVFGLFLSFSANATIWTVTNVNDSGAGSLRQAIDSANANPAGDTIDFSGPFPMQINLVSELQIDSAMYIHSMHPDSVILDGGALVRHMTIHGYGVELSGITFQNGDNGTLGGSLLIGQDASVTINDCQFVGNNTGGSGGAITVQDSADLVVHRSIFVNNTATGDGGALELNSSGFLDIINSTFQYNMAASGGAITDGPNAVQVNIYHCTIIQNDASLNGGGANFTMATIDLSNSLLWDNTASSNGQDIYMNSVYFGGSDFNFVGDSLNAGAIGPNSITMTDPVVDTNLVHVGGTYPPTIALLGGSPCIDAVDTSLSNPMATQFEDGRFIPRDSLPDIGAFEYDGGGSGVPPVLNVDSFTVANDSTHLLDVLANDFDPDGDLNISTLGIVVPPNTGTISVDTIGWVLEYIPDTTFVGVDSMLYDVCDSAFNCSSPMIVYFNVTGSGGGCIVDLGPDYYICNSLDSILLGGSVSGGASILWSHTGGGTFTNSSDLFTSYHPSSGDTSAGVVSLIVTANGGPCSADKDTVDIIFGSPTTANAGVDQMICANDSVQLIGTTGAPHVHWYEDFSDPFDISIFDNDTMPTVWYKPSAFAQFSGGIDVIFYAFDPASGCPPAEDTVHVTVTPKPDVFAGYDFTDTSGGASQPLLGSVVNAVGGIWTSSGTGTFTPDAMTLNATYTPSAADLTNGVAKLTLTSTGNGTCNAESDDIFITVQGCDITPTINIVNNNTVQFNSNLANSSALGHFFWDFGDGNIGYGPTPEHTYSAINNYNVTVGFTTDDFACFDTASVNVNITAVVTSTYSIDGTVRGGGNPLDTGFVVLFKEVNQQYDLIAVDDIGASDAGGYQFDNLTDGNYIVNAFPSHNSNFFWTYVPTYYDADTIWQNANVIAISGADSMNMDISLYYQVGDSTFTAGADTIFGNVLTTNADTNAREVNDGSVSANNVTVKLYNSSGTLITHTTTDNFGNFKFPNLPAGSYTVTLEYAGTGVTKTIPYVVDGNSSTKEQSTTTNQKTNTTTVGLGGSYVVVAENYAKVSPNPATDQVRISIDDPNFNGGDYILINSAGETLMSGEFDGQETELNVSSLASGQYHIIVADNGRIYRMSLIKI